MAVLGTSTEEALHFRVWPSAEEIVKDVSRISLREKEIILSVSEYAQSWLMLYLYTL